LPLVALAYLCFAAGLLAAFAGIAWLPIAVGFPAIVVAMLTGRGRESGLVMMLVAGTVIGATTPGTKGRRFEKADETGPLAAARARAAASIDQTFGEDAPMARALLIADQHRIPPEMKDRYARAGMVHMLSISGLHVAIIAGAVTLLLQAARVPTRVSSIFSVALIVLYVAIIGAPAPAVRSAVMLACVAASRAAQRPTSPWAGLALGAFVPLYSPRTVLDLGYQLSVVGIAGLIASGSLSKRLLAKRLGGWKLHISKELLTSVVATLITAPIIAWYFGRLSIIAPIANLTAGPVISVLQPLLFLTLAMAPFEGAAAFLADAAHPLLQAFDTIAAIAASVPGSSIAVVPSLVTVLSGAVAVIAFTIASASRYPARPVVAGMAFLCVSAWGPILPLPHGGGVEMHVLDVGQGDAVLVRTDGGNWLIFDAGRIWKTGDAGRSIIIPYVKSRGGDVRAFVLSHAHADHVGGAASVLAGLDPEQFWDSAFPQGSAVYDATLRTALDAGIEWRRVRAGDMLAVDGVIVRFLAPDSAWTASLDDPNEASTVARVEYGSSSFLLTGDAEDAEEAWLLRHARPDLAADVLKVAHHGSSTSSSDQFLEAVNPSLAVISVGADNLYGHPSADVLAGLSRVGARTLRTDQSGTIVIRTDGSRMTVQASGEEWDISRK
jgi:competence protein ComEC